MSDAVTALGGAHFEAGIARVAEMPAQGMVTLRADLSDDLITRVLKTATGIDMPGPGRTDALNDLRLCWMSPDEALLLCPYEGARDWVARLETALEGKHVLIANVSDARAVFTLEGAHARDVLAKLCPVDLCRAAFGLGQFRRTRMAQTAAAFWLSAENSFIIVCFRSHARYVFDLLSVAAQPGSEVNHLSQNA
jgi:sarcosine oxidase subunit gamma